MGLFQKLLKKEKQIQPLQQVSDEDIVAMASGMVVDVTVNKNQLDPTSNVGWLEALPLDPDDQPEQKPVEEVYHSIDITADDLPF